MNKPPGLSDMLCVTVRLNDRSQFCGSQGGKRHVATG